jgi:transcriptional regulator with XRE-family HTH domain
MQIDDAFDNPASLRRKLGLTQLDFWGRVGVTQSGGSRYEKGRRLPKPVRELIRRVYFKGAGRSMASHQEAGLAAFVRLNDPALYTRYLRFRRRQRRKAVTTTSGNTADGRRTRSTQPSDYSRDK